MYLVSRSGLRLRLFAVGRVYPILFLHHSIVMLCMLVTILSLDGVAGQGRGLRGDRPAPALRTSGSAPLH